MTNRQRQAGISFPGLMVLMIILGFSMLIGLKLLPIYMESAKIDTVLSSTVEDANVSSYTKADIRASIVKRLDINDVTRITDRNVKEMVQIEKTKKKVSITIAYQAEAPLFANLKLVADFNKVAETP